MAAGNAVDKSADSAIRHDVIATSKETDGLMELPGTWVYSLWQSEINLPTLTASIYRKCQSPSRHATIGDELWPGNTTA